MATKALWTKPELKILARGNPEENVLRNCKMENSPGGYDNQWDECGWWNGQCQDCLVHTVS